MRGSLRHYLGDIDHLVSIERSDILEDAPKQPNLASDCGGASEEYSRVDSVEAQDDQARDYPLYETFDFLLIQSVTV